MSSICKRKIAILAAGAALVGMGSLSGCSKTAEKEAPTTSSTTSTSAPASSSAATSPTEKAIGPGGDNSFSPTVDPAPPGAICNQIVNGVCQR